MQLDLILDTRAPAATLADLAVQAEVEGIRGIWVSSLLDSRDPYANLVPAAQATRRLLLGPVAVNPFDTHPVRIASSLLTLNELAAGRARIVIGGGGEALQALDIEPGRRVRAVAECVEILRAAARGAEFSYSGDLYTVRQLNLGWLKAEAPPIYVGASQQQMLRMAARVSDGIMTSDMPVSLLQSALRELDSALTSQAGMKARGPGDFSTNAFTAWHVYDDLAEARHEARRWLLLRGIFRPWLLREFLHEKDVELIMNSREAFVLAFREGSSNVSGVSDSVLDALVDNVTLCASTAQIDKVVTRLAEFADAGLSAISLRLYAEPHKSIRRLGQRVLPALREVGTQHVN